jgi:uncharacterized protein YndB with AHSA1/START domain
MTESIKVSTVLPAMPRQVFEAWLDSDAHGLFTGSKAEIDPHTGGAYTAWDGYIQGKTLEMEPYYRIFQTWRTDEFPQGCQDSFLEVLLEETNDGTKITLVHTLIPEGQAEQYKQGWLDYYFTPMTEYFSSIEE